MARSRSAVATGDSPGEHALAPQRMLPQRRVDAAGRHLTAQQVTSVHLVEGSPFFSQMRFESAEADPLDEHCENLTDPGS